MAVAKVLLIEDEAFTRTLLAAALANSLFEVHAGSSAKFAIDTVTSEKVDVAVLDLDLGGGPTGVDIAHALRSHAPRIGIIFLTSYTDPRLSGLDELRLPPGSRYLTKSGLTEVNHLVTTILRTKSEPLTTEPSSLATRTELTNHQIEILRSVAAGASNSEIANLFGVTDKAVEHTITRINDVLGITKAVGMNPRVQLVRAFSELAGKQLPSQN